MADVEFERRLERMFADAPAFEDADAFAQKVERKLDRGWTLRRWLIGAAGMTGGVVGASQLIMSNFVHRMGAASEGSAKMLAAGWEEVAPRASWLTSLPSSNQVIWLFAGLAILAMAFMVTRLIEEL